VEDSGVDEGVDYRARQPALALGLVGMLSDQGREIMYGSKCCMGHGDASCVLGRLD
jgi:hypothetical protein